MRNVILYIAMSLDGYIATKDGNLDFLSSVEKEGEDYGYHSFKETTDVMIFGRKTYEKVLSFGIPWPHEEHYTYIVSREAKKVNDKIEFYNGDLKALITELKSKPGKNIYCDGGGETVKLMLQAGVLDEIIVSVIPVLLGEGIRLFPESFPMKNLQLVSSLSFEKGLVQLKYKVK
jgi:dihydrofolate reductase